MFYQISSPFLQLSSCLQLKEDKIQKGEEDVEKKIEELELLKVNDIKFKKLPSNLTLSVLSPELNKSFWEFIAAVPKVE